MTEVVIAEDDGLGSMESNEEDSVRSLWKFCNSITLPRSEVVFFTQATLIFILVIEKNNFLARKQKEERHFSRYTWLRQGTNHISL